MSAEFQTGERLLTLERIARLDAWAGENRALIGLGGWRITFCPDELAGEDEAVLAGSNIGDEGDVTTIYLTRQWLEASDLSKRETLVHELLHCHFYRVTCLVFRCVSGALGISADAVLRQSVKLTEEIVIERLALGIAPLTSRLSLP